MQPTAPMFKAMMETSDQALEIALAEIKDLKKDLATLERILNGRGGKAADQFSLIDVPHGAFEIFRTASVVLENRKLLGDMQDAVDRSMAEDFLAEHGATLLKEPEGWHWISPKGVMRHLGDGDDPKAAAAKLKRYLPKTPKAKPAGQDDATDKK